MNWENKDLERQDKKEIGFSDMNLVIKISWDDVSYFGCVFSPQLL